MTSPDFASYLTCLFICKIAQATDQKFSSSHQRENSFVSRTVGESLTLQCFYGNDDSTRLYWYKQLLGQRPRLISTLYLFNKMATFHDEFQNNPRFTLDTEAGQNHLMIKNLHISDSATYYCARRILLTLDFAEGTFVSVKDSGSNVSALVHQSASESIQPGGSVTLNCTVHTGSCDGGHRVYWFKQSEEPHPGLIYTHEDRNYQCERKPDTQTHTCVYNLPMENLNLSHAGTYYCAVASCGHILFGDGTKLYIEDGFKPLVSVYFVSGALIFTTILLVLLAFSAYKMTKRSHYSESPTRFSGPSRAKAEGYPDADCLCFAGLRDNKAYRWRGRRDDTLSECVYSTVSQ